MYKRAKYLILLAIVTLSSAIGVINMPQTASAATANLYLAPEIKTAAKQSALRVSLALCLEIYGGGNLNGDPPFQTSASNIAKGDWFQNDEEPKVRAGYLVDPDNGVVECRNLFDGRNVAKDLGFGSNIELACAIKLSRMNDSNCENGSGTFTSDSTDKGKIYGALKGGFNDAQYYVMAANTYLTTCGGKAVTNLSDASVDQKNNDDYDRIKVVTGTGKIVDVLYTKKNNDDKAFRNFEDSFDYKVENCEWMASEMNRTAGKYADWVKAHPAENGDNAGPGTPAGEGEEGEEETVTCAVEGIGWIICPVVSFLALVADGAYEGIETLLVVTPISTATTSPTFTAWSTMRDFANVAFVGVFLFIIFSQLTSIGLNNYGIKKMLPRLIIAAVLVNVSYWLCAIAVDVSNIIGASLKSVLENAGASISAGEGADSWNGAGGWQGIAGGLMAGAVGAAILYAAIGALLPALVTAAFAIAMIFIVLSARQALILLWVVVSPLAFVAYLLPNTESLFKKWWTLGKTMLLLFAVIALLFGASALASDVILKSVGKDIDFTDGTTLQVILIVLMGGVIRIVPLFITPLAIKTLSGAAGRIGGYVNNPNKGPFDKWRKRAEATGNRIEGRRQIGALSGKRLGVLSGKYRREARREAINAGIARNAQQGRTSYVAGQALSDPNFQNQLAGGTRVPGWTPGSDWMNQRLNASAGAQNIAAANAISAQQSIESEEIKAATAVFEQLNLPRDAARELASGESTAGFDGSNSAIRAAAMARVVNKGDVEGVEGMLNQVESMDVATRQHLARALGESKLKPAYIGQGTLEAIRQGEPIGGKTTDANGNAVRDTKTDGTKLSVSEQLIANSIHNNTYSPEKIAQGDKDELARVLRVANDAKIVTDNAQLGQNAARALKDDRLQGQIGKNKAQVQALAAFAPPTPPTPPTPPSPGPTPPTP